MPSPLPRWVKSRWYLLLGRCQPFLVFMVFLLFSTGCARNARIAAMDAWVGHTEEELRNTLGEPMRVEPGIAEGRTQYVYENGWNPNTGEKCSSIPSGLSSGEGVGYPPACQWDIKRFHVNSEGQVVAWEWYGCWGNRLSTDAKPGKPSAWRAIGRFLGILLLVVLVVGIFILLSEDDETTGNNSAAQFGIVVIDSAANTPPKHVTECSFDGALAPLPPPALPVATPATS